ncbi:MAG TPA: hypothetical protein VKQ05_03550 [Gemmatimonadales bacterium]|nr:hypothetical protein [Gemmatimonadales bacterium]
MDAGTQPITDAVELKRVRSQARSVHLKAIISAAVLTVILIVL